LAHDGPVAAVAFAPDGKRVLTASADKTARLWPLSLVWAARHESGVRQAIFSPRGVLSCGDKVVRLWNSIDGKPIETLAGHEEAVVAVGTSADGAKVVSAGSDNKARVWDLNAKVGKEGRKPVAVIALPERPQSVALSPNGMRIAV